MNYYAVLGDPVAHSLSPVIQTALFEKYGIGAVYLKLRIEKHRPELIPDAIDMLSLSGFNVTMPHKESVIAYLDDMDETARRMGSVNTVICRGGQHCGFNTDGEGFAFGLSLKGESFTGEDVVFLGTGGAVKALAFKAAMDGAGSIRIFCRDEVKGREVQKSLRIGTGFEALVSPFQLSDIGKIPCTLLINGTPLGMAGTGKSFEHFEFLEGLSPRALVCDLIYHPNETELLLEAKRRGLQTHGGLPMLIGQALAAFRLFTGVETGFSDYQMLHKLLIR